MGSLTCEAVRGGWLAQPVNAWSNVGFFLAAVFVWWRAARADEARTELGVFGGVIAFAGVASFIFHGPAPEDLRWLDFAASVSAAWFIATHDAGVLASWAVRRRLGTWAALVAASVAALFIGVPIFVLGTVAAVCVIALEALALRRGLRPSQLGAPSSVRRAWYLAVAVMSLAGISYLLGTDLSPLCDPRGTWQFHACWHLLSATALAAYAYAAIEHDPEVGRPPWRVGAPDGRDS